MRTYQHLATTIAGRAIRAVREAPAGPLGLTLIGLGPGPARGRLGPAGGRRGVRLVEVDETTAEALRIEAGTPAFGRDVRPENLPQEIGRDARAISFVKGCYLGQETVARIDALGHVNKLLKGLRIEGDGIPPAGTPVEAGGKVRRDDHVGGVVASDGRVDRAGLPQGGVRDAGGRGDGRRRLRAEGRRRARRADVLSA
jgi:folate-binding protein YgfZ